MTNLTPQTGFWHSTVRPLPGTDYYLHFNGSYLLGVENHRHLSKMVDLAFRCYGDGITDIREIPKPIRHEFHRHNGHWFPTPEWCLPGNEDLQS